MNYQTEKIETAIAEIAECMARERNRAERLLGDVKRWVGELAAAQTYAAPVAAQKADDARDAERIRNAGAMLDCLTSKIADNHPLRIEAAEGAKRAVADLYRIADRLDAAIAQQRQGEGGDHGN